MPERQLAKSRYVVICAHSKCDLYGFDIFFSCITIGFSLSHSGINWPLFRRNFYPTSSIIVFPFSSIICLCNHDHATIKPRIGSRHIITNKF